jgi:invasion protein IalB
MKTWIIITALALSYVIAAGDTWALASAPQKPLPVRSASYCATHGGYSLACVLNGKAAGGAQ